MRSSIERQRLTRPGDTAASPARRDALRSPSHAEGMAAKILGMQQTLGNQAVQHRASTCPAFPSACPTGGACHTCPARVQAKLAISQPGDVYEQEADRVAERVMRMSQEAIVSAGAPAPHIQRLCPTCEDDLHRQPLEEEEEEETLEAKAITGRTPEVAPEIGTHISNLRGKGQPLPPSTRAFFEPRFGADFSHVRIHSNAPAAEAARSVAARAFTLGRDIMFGQGQYTPGTTEGRRLLAHELTHVLQQDGQHLMRQATSGAEEESKMGPPGRSARIPAWLLQQLERGGGGAPPEEEMTVARKPAGAEITHSVPASEASLVIFRVPTGPATGSCSWTCPPRGELPYASVSDGTFNCYAYAMNSPGSGFLQPGQIAGTVEFRALSGDAAAITALGGPAAAATHLQSNYFTPTGVRSQITADLGSPSSSNCIGCCAGASRKIIAVTTGPISAVGSAHWDFHWYRKDADRGWSHKRGSLDSQRDDATGAGPICSPCRASRSYAGLNYNHVIGAWCV